MIKAILPTFGASEPERCIGPCWCGAGCAGHSDEWFDGYYHGADEQFGVIAE
jgi:hypothetical protein